MREYPHMAEWPYLRETLDDMANEFVERVISKLRTAELPRKRYVLVKFLNVYDDRVVAGNPRRPYVYEDPWGDLQHGDIVERPSGVARVVNVDVPKHLCDNYPYKLTARFRREEA